MKSNLSIQLTALFLLVVFDSNTVIGSACAMGMDMGFNRSHCITGAKMEMPVHPNVKGHQHHHSGAPQQHHKEKKNKERGECCNDIVLKFSQADKTTHQSPDIAINSVFFTSLAADYHITDITYSSQVSGIIRYFVRSYHPPIPDIRISIRSFQI